MTRRVTSRLLRSTSGAVAPTIALSLFGLIAAGGIAFDYARMASMDTELQNAADHAALAAATQLDGQSGARARATAAAESMVVNLTYMSNDKCGTTVTVGTATGSCPATGSVTFYSSWDQTTNTGTAATGDSDAKYVEVTVDSRTAFYALTPISGALSSGAMAASAVAGLDSAICKVPPVMFCNPEESTDPDFTIANYIGKGIRLISNSGGGSYGPGNFGFLETNAGTGASVLGKELGDTTVPGDCVSANGVTTDPGNMISVRDALNTRFGIYTSVNNACGNTGSSCPPSANIRQDLLLRGGGAQYSQLGFVTSSTGNTKGWLEGSDPYPGSSNITTTLGTNYHSLSDSEISKIDPMGYPEDECHAFGTSDTGDCSGGLVGDGNWDRYAYFKSNAGSSASYSSMETSDSTTLNTYLKSWFGTTTPTRYQVYQWEMANASNRLKSTNSSVSPSLTAYSNPANLGGEPSAITPSSTNVDRRVLSVAVINCTAQGISGKTTDVQVQKWIDIFLVQPSEPRTVGVRTSNSDVYVEVIGETNSATNSGAVQVVKKSVPYLIE